MQRSNEHGVYEAEATQELARRGRSYAAVRRCQCDDGLYRYFHDVQLRGILRPITKEGEGFDTYSAAKGSRDQRILAAVSERLVGRTPERA